MLRYMSARTVRLRALHWVSWRESLVSVWCFLRARRSTDRRAIAWLAGSLLAFALGAISKETAWITPALWLLVELGVVRHGQPLLRRAADALLVAVPMVVLLGVAIDLSLGGPLHAALTPAYEQRLVVKSAGYIFFLDVDEIDWIEAAGNYVRLHVGSKTHLLRDTMNAMGQKLDPAMFARIHRSTIVNLHRIKRLRPLPNSEYVLLLHNGTELTSSRRYRNSLRTLLERSS